MSILIYPLIVLFSFFDAKLDKIVEIETRDYSQFKQVVANHETKNKYWMLEYSGGDGVGKYQLGYFCFKATNFYTDYYNLILHRGYSHHSNDSIKKKIFDEVFPLHEQELCMDKLIDFYINFIETQENLPLRFIANKYGLTEAKILGGCHYVGVNAFYSYMRNGNFNFANNFGYTLNQCMNRYKDVKITKVKKVKKRITIKEYFKNIL